MKNGKRWLALTAALCMAMPSTTAFATGADVTGEGNIEYDPKIVAPYYHVVLPTITDETYNFILDPFKELPKYDSVTYQANKTAYFTQTAPETLKNPESTTTDGKLYVAKYTEVATAGVPAALKAEFVDASGAIVKANTKNYFVWVPDEDNMPEGKYVELTAANVLDYCTAKDANSDVIPKPDTGTITSGIDMLEFNAKYNSGDFVFDNKLYELGYEELGTGASTPYTIDEFVDVDSSGTVSIPATGKKTLYTADAAGNTYTPVDATNVANYVEVVDAVLTKTDVSDTFKIVNKSSADTTVTATVTVENAGSLEFLTAAPATGSADASVWLQITGSYGTTTPTAVTESVELDTTNNVIEGEVSFDLAGLSDVTKYNTYMGDEIEATGGHEYVRYNMPSMSYESAELKLSIEANGDAASDAAWAAYVEELKDAYVPGANGQPGTTQKTKINVVYTLENDAAEVAVGDSMWNGTTLWFAINETGDGGFADHDLLTSVSVKKASTGNYTTFTDAADLAKVTFAANGWAGITWADLESLGQESGSVELKLTYDGVVYVVNN